MGITIRFDPGGTEETKRRIAEHEAKLQARTATRAPGLAWDERFRLLAESVVESFGRELDDETVAHISRHFGRVHDETELAILASVLGDSDA